MDYLSKKEISLLTGNWQYIILLTLPVVQRRFPFMFDVAFFNNVHQLLRVLHDRRLHTPPRPINQLQPTVRRSNRIRRQVQRLNL